MDSEGYEARECDGWRDGWRETFMAQAADMIEAEKTGVDCGIVTFEGILTGSGAGNSKTGPLRTLERGRLKARLASRGLARAMRWPWVKGVIGDAWMSVLGVLMGLAGCAWEKDTWRWAPGEVCKQDLAG